MPQYGKNALERGEEESMEQKEWGNESISFNFHLQVLVLVKTEMQILNYANVRTADSFSLTFSLNFLLFWFLRVHFLCLHFWQTEKYLK